MMPRRGLLGSLMLVVLAGCLPIELDVAQDGRVLIPRQEGFFTVDPTSGQVVKVYAPAQGEPMFAKFLSEDKQILALSKLPGGGMGVSTTMTRVDLTDGKTQQLATVGNMTYLTVSPDGKYAAYTRLADQPKGDAQEQFPELHSMEVATGITKALTPASSVAVIHRWFPDSKSILVFAITEKVTPVHEEGQEGQGPGEYYRGLLAKVDLADGKQTPLAAVLGGKDVFFDLSPDGKAVLFTALTAGKADATDLKPAQNEQLHELKLDSGAIRVVGPTVSFAVYSPNGKHVLLGGEAEAQVGGGMGMGGGEGLTLRVADADGGNARTIASDAMKQAGDMGDSAKIYPSWLGNDKVIYLTSRTVYGTTGKNLELVSIGIDGRNRTSLQATIDAAATK
ncbi:MAG: hypothetical protein WD042_20065 [Phycisphaeraceae bacterium]